MKLARIIKRAAKPSTANISRKIGVSDPRERFASEARRLLALIYQCDGRTWAIFNTKSGRRTAGTKAPQRKLLPMATTLTIPLMAFLFVMMLASKKARAVAQIVKTNELRI